MSLAEQLYGDLKRKKRAAESGGAEVLEAAIAAVEALSKMATAFHSVVKAAEDAAAAAGSGAADLIRQAVPGIMALWQNKTFLV